jgi:DNA-binding MarR family transcriptional regulator
MDDVIDFLRHAHLFGFAVRSVLEEKYLRESVGDGVTFTQLNLLKMIASPGRHYVGDVAHFLDASYAAASKMTDRLVAGGLVRSVRRPPDRRAEALELTPKGRGAIDRYERHKLSCLKAKLKGVSARELKGMTKVLERLLGIVLEGRDLIQRACLQCGAYYSPTCFVRAAGAECPYWRERVAGKLARRLTV